MEYYPHMSAKAQTEAHSEIADMVAVFAADAMCHPRARVGKFDWSDVVQLTESLSYCKPSRMLQVVAKVHGQAFVKNMIRFF